MRLPELLQEAYRRQGTLHFCGEVEGYCENQGCPAREVRITYKEDVDEALAERAVCPLCGTGLKIHDVRTFDEVVRAEHRFRELNPGER